MPILLRFYLAFTLRNKIFTEKNLIRNYEKALKIVEKAEEELPFTFTISRGFPDAWGTACAMQWVTPGSFLNSSFSPPATQPTTPDGTDDLNKPKLVDINFDLGEKKIRERAPEDEWATAKTPEKDHADDLEATIEEFDENAPAAENLVNDDPPVPDNSSSWFQSDESPSNATVLDPNAWILPKEDPAEVDNAWAAPSIMSAEALIGSSEPLAKVTPVRAEESTRVIIGVQPPDLSSSDPFLSRLATLTLAPWPNPNPDTDSLLQPAKSLECPGDPEVVAASIKRMKYYNPNKDEIRVLIAPNATTAVKPGMAMGGVWVQVGDRVEPSSEQEQKPYKKDGTNWWYLEKLYHALPSYFTEQDPQRDMTRMENHPEYAYDF